MSVKVTGRTDGLGNQNHHDCLSPLMRTGKWQKNIKVSKLQTCAFKVEGPLLRCLSKHRKEYLSRIGTQQSVGEYKHRVL